MYLLHFDEPLAQARHYLGFTEDLSQRLAQHRSGSGARLMQVITEQGIDWQLARTWEGKRTLERRLKKQPNGPRLCPLCQQIGAPP